MDKKKTVRYALAAAVAIAVSIPLIAQVKRAQSAPPNQPAAVSDAPSAPEPTALPATRPVDADPAKVIVRVGEITLTAGEFDAATADIPAQNLSVLSDPAVRKRIADKLLQIKQLAAEAKNRGLQEQPLVKAQIELQSDETLANALVKQVQTGGSETEARAFFDKNKSQFDDVKARHILIRTPGSPVPLESGKKELSEAQAKAKADAIEQRLSKGEDFAAIAKTESDDTGSGLKGGDLGTFAPYKMDATFAKATLALQKNQISQPVKTQFGYHIIQLLDDKPRTYEQAKEEIPQVQLGEVLNPLKDTSNIHYDSAFFGGTSDAPATQPANPTH